MLHQNTGLLVAPVAFAEVELVLVELGDGVPHGWRLRGHVCLGGVDSDRLQKKK